MNNINFGPTGGLAEFLKLQELSNFTGNRQDEMSYYDRNARRSARPNPAEETGRLGLAQPPTRSGAVEAPVRDTKSYEGFRDKVYTDTTGNATIGYGHKLTEDDIKTGRYSKGISQADAESLYNTDRQTHDAKFYERNSWAKGLPQNQRAALEDMAYNMGSNFLEKWPKTRQALQAGDYDFAANEVKNSKYAKQVGQRALDNANLLSLR